MDDLWTFHRGPYSEKMGGGFGHLARTKTPIPVCKGPVVFYLDLARNSIHGIWEK